MQKDTHVKSVSNTNTLPKANAAVENNEMLYLSASLRFQEKERVGFQLSNAGRCEEKERFRLQLSNEDRCQEKERVSFKLRTAAEKGRTALQVRFLAVHCPTISSRKRAW